MESRIGSAGRAFEVALDLAFMGRHYRPQTILPAEHVAAPREGLIRAHVRGGELVGYLVRGSGGAVYRVEARGCLCPDHHGRHRRRSEGSRVCKYALACWALWRAASGASHTTKRTLR